LPVYHRSTRFHGCIHTCTHVCILVSVWYACGYAYCYIMSAFVSRCACRQDLMICLYMCMYSRIHVFMKVYMYACMHIWMDVDVDVCVCVYMHVHACVCMKYVQMYTCISTVCGIHIYASHICKYAYTTQHTEAMRYKKRSRHSNGWVATISRLLKITSLFSKRDLQKRRYSAKETYNFKEPTKRSHPIPSEQSKTISSQIQNKVKNKIKSKTK